MSTTTDGDAEAADMDEEVQISLLTPEPTGEAAPDHCEPVGPADEFRKHAAPSTAADALLTDVVGAPQNRGVATTDGSAVQNVATVQKMGHSDESSYSSDASRVVCSSTCDDSRAATSATEQLGPSVRKPSRCLSQMVSVMQGLDDRAISSQVWERFWAAQGSWTGQLQYPSNQTIHAVVQL
mmetsp:Transcript_162850/g.522083  ORF Transcript_162850/g.522083 Transcript_162850/m.522083 type:complete len:182 (+) Transcript_162850:127-672(+)